MSTGQESRRRRTWWPAVGVGGRMLVLAGVLLWLPGCALYSYFYGGSPQREVQRTDQELLRSAETSLQRRRYEEARQDLQRLMNQYPESELLSAARLASAKALYLGKKFDESRVEYQRFLELHPQHERADEAHYYLAMTYFRQSDSPDRDQTYTRKALDQFELLLKQMPDSPFAPDSREKSGVARRKLAEKEAYVGRFYFGREHYAAAAARFTNLLAQYPAAGYDDEALYFLGESLWHLEQKDAARAAFERLVQDHSQSPWAGPSASRLGIALVRTGPPRPEGPGVVTRMWRGLQETWNELAETISDYQIFR